MVSTRDRPVDRLHSVRYREDNARMEKRYARATRDTGRKAGPNARAMVPSPDRPRHLSGASSKGPEQERSEHERIIHMILSEREYIPQAFMGIEVLK